MQKVVLVTGGSSGIGKTICEYLSSKNFIVYGTSRDPRKVQEKVSFNLLELDVTKPETIEKAVAKVVAEQGRVDVLVNNAGVGITGPIEETPIEEVEKAFKTNLYGPINLIKAVLPVMRKQNNGLIINITSIAGYMGLPYRGIYSATKGALELVTEALSIETKDFNVKVTNVAPGDFATNIAAGRYHTPVYEHSAYKKPYANTLKLIDADVTKGANPILVAKKVHKIINTANPKLHYKVGAFMEKFSVVLKAILPDKVYEKLLINHYKL